ncbi:hypothetical protein F3J20_30735 [Paraburkholderia sp. Cy-641]|uniref:hypothetical protein n=1 Tax=Paraburkholderia sp. Cy-641 TaxID=2608337 RepID=UPI001421115B|nr:hypothetical protein [Paraburkholderia sp. Cy-641]NIF81693.1 hypothetical protein [Paraburkholderia sp. Cy-641]
MLDLAGRVSGQSGNPSLRDVIDAGIFSNTGLVAAPIAEPHAMPSFFTDIVRVSRNKKRAGEVNPRKSTRCEGHRIRLNRPGNIDKLFSMLVYLQPFRLRNVAADALRPRRSKNDSTAVQPLRCMAFNNQGERDRQMDHRFLEKNCYRRRCLDFCDLLSRSVQG